MKATIIVCVVLGVWVCGAFCSEQMAEGKNSWKLQKGLKSSGVGRIFGNEKCDLVICMSLCFCVKKSEK